MNILFILIGIIGLLGAPYSHSEYGQSFLTHSTADPIRYRIDGSRSRLIVHAFRGGIAWFKGHDHLVGARDIDGEASVSFDSLNTASLQFRVGAASLEETSDDFTAQQKGIIKKELDDIVMETAKYPDIVFKSTEVQGSVKGGILDVKISGDLTLHGVTKHIVIPAMVTLTGDTLQAKGTFTLDRKKFNVNATSAFHGFVRVKHKLEFTFDIIAHRL